MSRLALSALLRTLGALLARASRSRSEFRAALSADRIIAIETDDGVAYRFVARDRFLGVERGTAEYVDLRLRFATSREALGVLTSDRALGRMLDGMARGSVSLTGNLMLFLWFQGRLSEAMPFAARRRRPDRFPGAYTRPRHGIAAARSITREASAASLDPAWENASKQRAKLLLTRVAAGERAPTF